MVVISADNCCSQVDKQKKGKIPFLIPESQFQIRAESDVYSSEEGFMSKQQNCNFCKDKRSYNDALDSPSLL